MKKILSCLAAATLLLAFGSCKEDDPLHSGGFTKISGVIQNMPDDAEKYILKSFIFGEDDDLLVASCDVTANGSFSLTLPETVSSSYLDGIAEGSAIPANISITNPSAKMGELYFELYGDDEYIDDINFASFSYTDSYLQASSALPVYCNSPCTINGSVNEGENVHGSVNIHLVKGWNWIVVSISGTEESATASVTSLLPTGLKWFLSDDLPDFGL